MSGINSYSCSNNYSDDFKSVQTENKSELSEKENSLKNNNSEKKEFEPSLINDTACFSKAGSLYTTENPKSNILPDLNFRFPVVDEGAGSFYNQKAFCFPFLDTKSAKEDDLNVIVKMEEIIKNSGK